MPWLAQTHHEAFEVLFWHQPHHQQPMSTPLAFQSEIKTRGDRTSEDFPTIILFYFEFLTYVSDFFRVFHFGQEKQKKIWDWSTKSSERPLEVNSFLYLLSWMSHLWFTYKYARGSKSQSLEDICPTPHPTIKKNRNTALGGFDNLLVTTMEPLLE